MNPTPPPTRYVNDSYHPAKKPLRCILGFHKWNPWKEVEGSFQGNDPAGWYWTWQMQRTCKCCDKTEEEWS